MSCCNNTTSRNRIDTLVEIAREAERLKARAASELDAMTNQATDGAPQEKDDAPTDAIFCPVGSIVILKTGGPQMTVTGVSSQDRMCAYFNDDDELSLIVFNQDCLLEGSVEDEE